MSKSKKGSKSEVKVISVKVTKVWDKAKPIRGQDPVVVRQDAYGNKLRYENYGKSVPSGWHVDHIKPKSKGGSDHIRNLQILQSNLNMKKQDSLVKKSRHNQK